MKCKLTESERTSFSLFLNPVRFCSPLIEVLTASAAGRGGGGGVGSVLDLAGADFFGRDLKANFFFGSSWS